MVKREQKGKDTQKETEIVEGNLQVSGIIKAKEFLQFSDLRLKANIREIVDALSIVQRLEGKQYRWKKHQTTNRDSQDDASQLYNSNKVFGLIAQDVQQVIPEIVREDSNGFLAVSYIELIPILLQAFNQLLCEFRFNNSFVQQRVQELQDQVDSLCIRIEANQESTKEIPGLLHNYEQILEESIMKNQTQKEGTVLVLLPTIDLFIFPVSSFI